MKSTIEASTCEILRLKGFPKSGDGVYFSQHVPPIQGEVLNYQPSRAEINALLAGYGATPTITFTNGYYMAKSGTKSGTSTSEDDAVALLLGEYRTFGQFPARPIEYVV